MLTPFLYHVLPPLSSQSLIPFPYHSQNKKVVIGDVTVHYPDGAMNMDERLMGLKGLAESVVAEVHSTIWEIC